MHSSDIGGHSGIRATHHRIKRIFYYSQMKKSVETFVSECHVCQRSKSKNCQYPRLLSPLPIPEIAWSFISMDFVEGLPKSGGKDTILVVVDRMTKCAHFIALAHPFTAQSIAQLFIDQIIKLHGIPVAIVTDRNNIFTSKLWQDIFKSMKISLQFSTTYHPQTGGQTERVNQCMESYLRCMIFHEPKKWISWLPLAKY
jgi:transposase InsO family protein